MTKFKKGHTPWNKGLKGLKTKKQVVQKKTKQAIIEYLKSKDNYQELDHNLIDRLIFKERLISYLQKQIDNYIKGNFNDDIKVAILQARNFRQNVELEKKTSNDIDSILKLLGLTPQERIKLKLVEPEEENPLNEFD